MASILKPSRNGWMKNNGQRSLEIQRLLSFCFAKKSPEGNFENYVLRRYL